MSKNRPGVGLPSNWTLAWRKRRPRRCRAPAVAFRASSNLGRLIATHAGNLSEAPRIASLPGPAIWKADEYEKLLEDNIRRYHQEADGLAPEDAKVEAVGAALDAG